MRGERDRRGRRARRSPTGTSGGTTVRTRRSRYAQRGWKAQPGGMRPGVGGAPAIATRSCSFGASGCGSASSSARVYGMARPLQDVFARTGLDDAPRVEDRDAVGDRREHAEVVRDQHDRELVLAAEPVEQAQDPRLHGDVERRRRLVGDQQPRPAGESDRDRDPLPHPARELVREPPQRGLRVGDAHVVQQLDRALVRRAAVEPQVEAHVLGELLADREHRVQRRVRVLEDHRDVAPRDALQAAS